MSATPLESYETNSTKKSTTSRRVIWIIALALCVFGFWAANAPLEEIVRGQGKVVPARSSQIIQNLEGGIVAEVFVVEGDVVEAQQRVVRMDATQFRSAFQELREQRLALMLKLERLSAEQDQTNEYYPSTDLAALAPEYADSELALFEARRKELVDTLASLEEAARLRRQEVEILEPMVERTAVPEIDLIRAEQAAVDAEGRISTTLGEFEVARSEEYSETLVRLRQVEEQIRAREDQLRRTDVLSPVRGIVNRVSVTTIGGVVNPGEELIEVLPLDEALRVEGRIDPRDIGFVFAGMPATIKLTAFDFSVYGTLTGRVVHVGADTVTDETQREPVPYYEVFVELDNTALEGPTGVVEIRPGMQAEVELKSGERTVLEYLLKPLFRTTEAFRER